MVEIGNIYNIGIGLGEKALCRVVYIEKGCFHSDKAVLELINYPGGPFFCRDVEALEKEV